MHPGFRWHRLHRQWYVSSSINRMTSGDFSNSFITAFIRSSNCPRYLVPATRLARSRVTTLLPNKHSGNFFLNYSSMPNLLRWQFFLRQAHQLKLDYFSFFCSKSDRPVQFPLSLPTIGSSLPSSAILVRSLPKLSRTGCS